MYEWFKHYLNDEIVLRSLENLLLRFTTVMFCYQSKEGVSPEGFNDGVISLLFKKGNRTELKNYRPLQLINTAYNICSGLITKRLPLPFCKIIGPH